MTVANRSTRGKPFSSDTLSTTNPTWTGPGSNPGLRGERPVTNRLSHGTASSVLPNRCVQKKMPTFYIHAVTYSTSNAGIRCGQLPHEHYYSASVTVTAGGLRTSDTQTVDSIRLVILFLKTHSWSPIRHHGEGGRYNYVWRPSAL